MRESKSISDLKIRSRKAVAIVREQGATALVKKIHSTATKRFQKQTQKYDINFLVKYNDALIAKWSSDPYKPQPKKKTGPLTINWVMHPPGHSGGGHQNMIRFIRFLEDSGHICRIYYYAAGNWIPKSELDVILDKYYPKLKAERAWLDGPMAPADVTFATGWETAYPVLNDPGSALKFYFVQDFEPYFYPVGTEYILAENTYRFNFFGITAGKWLEKKLTSEYGMRCASYDFGAEKKLYNFVNNSRRKEIFFYARPVTSRRGFELGIMTLELVAKALPDYTITLAGWDVSNYNIPFKYKNLKTLKLEDLNEIYNKCAVALIISLTNMSLMPLEVLAAGTIPVLNKGPNNQEVSNNPYIHYADPSPEALAKEIIAVVSMPKLPEYAKKASESVADVNWEDSCRTMEKILKKELNNG